MTIIAWVENLCYFYTLTQCQASSSHKRVHGSVKIKQSGHKFRKKKCFYFLIIPKFLESFSPLCSWNVIWPYVYLQRTEGTGHFAAWSAGAGKYSWTKRRQTFLSTKTTAARFQPWKVQNTLLRRHLPLLLLLLLLVTGRGPETEQMVLPTEMNPLSSFTLPTFCNDTVVPPLGSVKISLFQEWPFGFALPKGQNCWRSCGDFCQSRGIFGILHM